MDPDRAAAMAVGSRGDSSCGLLRQADTPLLSFWERLKDLGETPEASYKQVGKSWRVFPWWKGVKASASDLLP